MQFIEKRSISSSDRIIAISNFTKTQIQRQYGVSEDKIARIYLGVDASGYEDSGPKIDQMRKRLGLEKVKTVLFVGRIDDPRKGLDVLLKAFGMTVRRMNLRLLVVGDGQVEKAERMASVLGIRDKTVFAGSLQESELKTCYAMCDLVVCPSRLEGFGFVIVEAMAAGKPIVATRAGSIPEILRDGVNGLLVPNGDYALMSEAMLAILSNPELTRIFSAKNKENAKSYDWSSTAKKTIEVYDQLVGGRRITRGS
jgi:glycosyltransferase involved in cell wall biosynthesis